MAESRRCRCIPRYQGKGETRDSRDILTLGFLKEDGHEGTEIAGRVLEGEVVAGETASRNVLNGPDVLDVGGVLALARHPHGVAVLLLLAGDVVLQVVRHVRRQL